MAAEGTILLPDDHAGTSQRPCSLQCSTPTLSARGQGRHASCRPPEGRHPANTCSAQGLACERDCSACRCADENFGILLQHPDACSPEALALFQNGTCTCCLGLCRFKRCLLKPADSQHLKRQGGRPAFDVRQTLVYHAHRLLTLFAHFQLLQQQKDSEVSLCLLNWYGV